MAKDEEEKSNSSIPGLEEFPEESERQKESSEYYGADEKPQGKGIMETLSDIYYHFEDKYYDFLDKVNEKIPIYKVIDPIDNIFPSFMLVILLVLILFLLLLFVAVPFIFSAIGPKTAVFKVIDQKQNPLQGVSITVTQQGQATTEETDGFGVAEIEIKNEREQVEVKAEKAGYVPYSAVMQPSIERENEITLSKEETAKTISILVKDRESSDPLSVPVDYTFACSGGGSYAPSSMKRASSQTSIIVNLGCGLLSITAVATGYDSFTVNNIDVSSRSAVEISLPRKPLTASLSVIVSKCSDSQQLGNITVRLKKLQEDNYIDTSYVKETDSSGAVRFQNIALGTYYAVAEDLEGTYRPTDPLEGEITLIEGDSETVELCMKPLVEPKKIMLKFVDAESAEPIRDVSVRIFKSVSDGSYTSVDVKISTSDGFVEKQNLDGNATYYAVASHAEYVTKVIDEISLIDESSDDATVVELEKAIVEDVDDDPTTVPNAGILKVHVQQYGDLKPVEGATVILRNPNYPFFIASAYSNEQGYAEFINLPPGTYYAVASKGSEEGKSENVLLAEGEIKEVSVILVMGKIKFTVTVKSASSGNPPIENAQVSFIDAENESRIGDAVMTSAQGKAEKEIRLDRTIYLLVQKEGYLPYTSAPFIVSQIGSATILLNTEADFPGIGDPKFDILLQGITSLDGRQVSKLDANKEYLFRFKLLLIDGGYSNVYALVRGGLQSQINAEDSNVVIDDLYVSMASVAKSGCYSQNDNYADCSASVDAGAKQAIAYYTSLNSGVYEIIAKVRIKQGTKEVELRFGTKADKDGTTAYKPNQEELYLFKTSTGQNICSMIKDDCPIEFSFSVFDEEGNELKAESGKRDLQLEKIYSINYEIYNPTDSDLLVSSLLVKDVRGNIFDLDPETEQVDSTKEIAVDSFGRGSMLTGSLSFKTVKDSQSASIVFDLGLNRKDSNATLNFLVIPISNIKIISVPSRIFAEQQNPLVIKVVDTKNDGPIKGARIFVYELPDISNPLMDLTQDGGGMTNEKGIYNILLPPKPSGTVFRIVAQKPNFRDANIELEVLPNALPLQGAMDCLVVDKNKLEISRGASANFKITNNKCNENVSIKLEKSIYSDIMISEDEFTLANNESKTITVSTNAVLGIHPIYIEAKADSDFIMRTVALTEAYVTDRSSCLQVKDDKFEYNVMNTTDQLSAENNCYSGYSHDVNKIVEFPEAQELSAEFINALEPESKKKIYDYLLRNIGLRDNLYIDMALEDYICAISGRPGC